MGRVILRAQSRARASEHFGTHCEGVQPPQAEGRRTVAIKWLSMAKPGAGMDITNRTRPCGAHQPMIPSGEHTSAGHELHIVHDAYGQLLGHERLWLMLDMLHAMAGRGSVRGQGPRASMW